MQSTIAPSPPYRLADHVRACRVDEQVLLLDLRRNKYLGIGGPQLSALGQAIVDWPGHSSNQTSSQPEPGLKVGLQPLLDQRMLADAGTAGPPSTWLAEPLESVDLDARPGRPSPAWRDLLKLAWAASVAALWMKRRSLADIASSVARLRPRIHSEEDSASTAELRAAVSSYTRLRPFLFTAHDQCLHDSLTLIRFLAKEGMYPSWVIGVRTRPFAAHSWVQHGHLVLNDVHEHVRTYTPILVV
jgi:hypothetical protein